MEVWGLQKETTGVPPESTNKEWRDGHSDEVH